MTNEAKDLLKREPELCGEIFMAAFRKWWDGKYYGHCEEHLKEAFDCVIKANASPDWEILSFKSANGNIYTLQPDGEYKFLSSFDKDNMLNCVDRGAGVIHSVRRSDGEVFEVDEIISLGSDNKYTLTGFEVENGHMFIKIRRENDFGGISSGRTYLSDAVKLKPLFKTHDGVPVYEDDEVTPVDTIDFDILKTRTGYNGEAKHLKYFSTRSAAEKWVRDNKPQPERKQVSVREQLLNFYRQQK